MANLLGPYSLTVGQPFKVVMSATTRQVEVQNDSPYDVWVAFASTAPNDPTNVNGSWHRRVRRDHNAVLPVDGVRGATRGERSINAYASFGGVMWLLAVNPGGLATSGTISNRNQVSVLPLEPGDPIPTYSVLSTQVDLTSQPRVIAVPVVSQQAFTGAHDFAAPGSFQPFGNIIVATLTPPTPSQAFVYCYGAQCSCGGGASGGQFTVDILELKNDLSTLATHTLFTFQVEHTNTGDGVAFAPAMVAPWGMKIGNLNAQTAFLAYQLTAVGVTGTPRLMWNLLLDADTFTGSWPGGVGYGTFQGTSLGSPVF